MRSDIHKTIKSHFLVLKGPTWAFFLCLFFSVNFVTKVYINKNYFCFMGKFNDIIQAATPTLVDFHATWCGPCKMMSPVLEQFKKAYGEKVRILKIDVDKNPDLAQQFKVRGVPTLLLFKDGKLLWRESGAFPLATLKQKIGGFL